MTDLVERLRAASYSLPAVGEWTAPPRNVCTEAADEIERLRADAARYAYIRANGEPDAGMAYDPEWTLEKYDAAIDAAIRALDPL